MTDPATEPAQRRVFFVTGSIELSSACHLPQTSNAPPHFRISENQAFLSASSSWMMGCLLGEIDLAEGVVLFEEAVDLQLFPEVESMAVAEQESTDGHRAAVAGDLDAPLRERGGEQTQDVELVGDEASVWEEALGEALVRVAHIERDEADVVT